MEEAEEKEEKEKEEGRPTVQDRMMAEIDNRLGHFLQFCVVSWRFFGNFFLVPLFFRKKQSIFFSLSPKE